MIKSTEIIKEKLDIATVIGSYIKIEKSGINWKARCPFHNEKTPSFFISSARQTFYCFGCQEKGDIFTFVEKFEGLDFKGALESLAGKAGVEIGKFQNEEVFEEKNELLKVMKDAEDLYVSHLKEYAHGKSYLLNRGITEESITLWNIGYAQDAWRDVYENLLSRGYSKEILLEAGLIKKVPNEEKYYDTFRDRIMFPISDSAGRVIAFSGRAMKSDDKTPKYLNSPETKLFYKSETLYGFHVAKNHIRKLDYTILVEGQMDLVMAHQAGTQNTVASSGTALTELHLQKIKKLSNRVVIAYDGDKAGMNATYKAGKLALALGMEVKVATLKEGEDPASTIHSDPEVWKKSLKDSVHLIDRTLEEALGEPDDRTRNHAVVERVLPLLVLIKSEIEKSQYIKKIALRLRVEEGAVKADLARVAELEKDHPPSSSERVLPEGTPLSRYPTTNLKRIVTGPLARCPERTALVGRHARYTYAQLDEAVELAARALHALGVGEGDRVAASITNHPDIVIAFLATMRLGAIWVGIARPLAAAEKAFMLRDGEVAVFLGDRAMAAQVTAARGELPALLNVVVAEPGDSTCEWAAALEAARLAPGLPRISIDPFAPAAIAYTSGTTGFPKGAVHSQHNLLLPGAVAAATSAYPMGQVQGVLLPLTVLNLMVLVPLLTFQIDGTCVCMDRVDAVGVAEWVRMERVGHFAAVPAIYHDLLTHADVRTEDLASLARPEVGGAECPPAFLRLYRERFGADVSIGYGMTEAPTAVTRSLGDRPPEPGLIGTALPQVSILLVDQDGREVADGEVGEVCVAPAREGPFAGVYTPMLGYWNKPDETAKALKNGVLHTGDLGMRDHETGQLYIRGRRGDLILRGGANVYPAEIERVLQGDPRVAACAVLGVPDDRLGERVIAAVQLAEGAGPVAEEELRDLCAASLARYKVPERFHFVERVPRNAMGKIVKRELRVTLGLPG